MKPTAAPSARPSPHAPDAPEPRVGTALAAGVYLVLSLAYFLKALLPDRLIAASDYLAGGYHFYDFTSHQLASGILPRWVPYVYGGLPLFANPGSTFYPVHLLAGLVLPTGKIFPVVLIVQFWLAGLGMYLLAREIGSRPWVAFVSGLLFQFTGVTLSWVYAGHDGRIIVATLAPITLAFLHRGIRTGRPGPFAGAAGAIGFALLSFQIQNAWYLLVGGFIWTTFCLVHFRRQVPSKSLGIRAALAAGAVVFGFVMAGVNFLPFQDYIAASPRGGAEGRGYEYSVSFSAAPSDLLGMAVPEQVGSSVGDPETGEAQFPPYHGPNGFKLHTEYVGAAALLLLALGAWYSRRDRYWQLFAALGVFFLSMALGGNTPLYHLYYAVLPGIKRFRAPDLAYYMVALSLAAMAAVTLERLARLRDEAQAPLHGRRHHEAPALGPFWYIAGGLVAVVVIGAGYASGHPIVGPDGQAASAAGGWTRFALFAGATAAALWWWLRGTLPSRAALVILSVLSVADLWIVGRHFFFTGPGADTTFAADEVIDFLRRQPQPSRTWVLPFQPYHNGGDYLMGFGLDQVAGEHPVPLQRYVEYIGTSRSSTADFHNVLGGDPGVVQTPNGQAIAFPARAALLDAANVRYVVATAPLAVAGLREVFRGREAIVYENAGALPRAYLVPRAVPVKDKGASLAAILAPGWDPRRTAIVEAPTDLGVNGDAVRGDARVTEYAPTHVAVRTQADRTALLVLADNEYKGWTATVDGRDVPVVYANHTFRGVPVPAGAHEVRFEFRPDKLYLGFYVYLACLLLLAGYGVWLAMAHRRGRAAPLAEAAA
ncbi:MAG: hypothetical protein JWM27_1349 [Gemmatimonadetes bacterium]|nr:hypothetical protein [Gemmatimonadota bacterium]